MEIRLACGICVKIPSVSHSIILYNLYKTFILTDFIPGWIIILAIAGWVCGGGGVPPKGEYPLSIVPMGWTGWLSARCLPLILKLILPNNFYVIQSLSCFCKLWTRYNFKISRQFFDTLDLNSPASDWSISLAASTIPTSGCTIKSTKPSPSGKYISWKFWTL